MLGMLGGCLEDAGDAGGAGGAWEFLKMFKDVSRCSEGCSEGCLGDSWLLFVVMNGSWLGHAFSSF